LQDIRLPLLPARFFGLFDSAEPHQRSAPRFWRTHSYRQVCLYLLIEMIAKLLVQFLLHLPPAEDRA
jgi:hypothetical protein